MTENQWNKEIVREYFRCVRDRDLDRLLIYMHPSVRLDVPGDVIGAACTGTSEVQSYFERVGLVIAPGVQIKTTSVIGENHKVFADTVMQGRFVDDEDFAVRLFWLFSFQDRKIAGITLSFDTQEFARLAGQDTTGKETAAA